MGSGVAQLVEQLLPIPEVRGSNSVIGKTLFIYWTFVFCRLCIEKTKIKKKEAENGPLLRLDTEPHVFENQIFAFITLLRQQ